MFRSVGEFHEKFGLPVTRWDRSPHIIDDEAFGFRFRFLQEEMEELRYSHEKLDLAGIADALADLAYVVMGTAHMYGIPLDDVFRVVHEANMKKKRAESPGESKRGSILDVVKPEGWEPPDVESVLGRYGHDYD